MPTAVLGHAEPRHENSSHENSSQAGMEEAAGARGCKRDHHEMSHVMALVEAARKVRAITAQPCAHGQMGSQFGPRERLRPSSVDVRQDVTVSGEGVTFCTY